MKSWTHPALPTFELNQKNNRPYKSPSTLHHYQPPTNTSASPPVDFEQKVHNVRIEKQINKFAVLGDDLWSLKSNSEVESLRTRSM